MVRWIPSLDKVGACAGAVCAVHCLLTGVALGLLSAMGLEFLGSVAAEATFLGIAAALGIVAVVHGRRRHHSLLPASVFVLGLLAMTAGHFLTPHRHVPASAFGGGSSMQTALAVFGGLCLVAFHILNIRLRSMGGCGCSSCHSRASSPVEAH